MTPNRPVILSIVQYLNELESGALTVPDLIDKADALGVDGIELRREQWTNYQTELPAVRDQLAARGKIVTYGSFSTLFNADQWGRDLLRHDLDTAKALGSPLLRVFPGLIPDDTGDPAWADAQAAVDYAAELGIAVALENYARVPGNTSAEVIKVLGEIQSDALKTNVDVGNYFANGEDVVAVIDQVGDRAIYAHLKDQLGGEGGRGDATYLGGGAMPMRAIMDALDALPQSIIYCFEFGGEGDPDGRIQKSLAFLRGE